MAQTISLGAMNMEVSKDKKDVDREDLEGLPADEPEQSKSIKAGITQITIRGIVVSVIIGTMYSVIAMKLNLTTGMVPNLNVSAALLAFVFMRTWIKVLEKAGFVSKPFTRQENTMIQTCAVACYSIAVGGNFSLCTFFFGILPSLLFFSLSLCPFFPS